MDADEAEAVELIGQYVAWFNNVRIEELGQPSAGSRADREAIASGPHRWLLERGRHLAAMRLLTTRSCIDAIRHCADLPDPVAPIHALSRSAIEQSAWALWLVDCTVESEERCRRVAADLLHGDREIDRIARAHCDHTIGPVIDRLIERFGDVQPANRPTSTVAVSQLFAASGSPPAVGEIVYRLHSALPHGSAHALGLSTPVFDGWSSAARRALLGSMYAFDVFTLYMGWGGRPAWRSWAGRAEARLFPRSDG